MLKASLKDTVFRRGMGGVTNEERPSKGLSIPRRKENETGSEVSLKTQSPRLKPSGPVEEFSGARLHPSA
jgi:hypothetical protein